MSRRLRRQLRLEHKRRLNEATEHLLHGDSLDGAKQNLEWLATLARLQQSIGESARARWTLGIAIVSVLLIACAWSIRIPRAHFIIDVEAAGIQLRISNDWESTQSLTAERVVLNGMSGIRVPGIAPTTLSQIGGVPTASEIKNGKMTVAYLSFGAGASVELSANEHEVELFIRDGAVFGELYVESVDVALERGLHRIEIPVSVDSGDPPETITFDRSARRLPPASIRLFTRDPWQVTDLQVDQLGFLEEVRGGSGVFRSTIVGGQVETLESGLKVALNEGDCLELRGILTKRLDLSRSTNGGIRVTLEGSATTVLTGPRGFERNLKPSLLTYLYHQQPLAILWSSVAFLFGLIWRTRGALFAYR